MKEKPKFFVRMRGVPGYGLKFINNVSKRIIENVEEDKATMLGTRADAVWIARLYEMPQGQIEVIQK